MTRRVEWTAASERDLRRLDHRSRERIREAVERLAAEGSGDVKRLQGRDREWRLRVGDQRVLFTVVDDLDDAIVQVIRVLPRGRAYRG